MLIATNHANVSELMVQQLVSTGTNIKMLFFALGPENAAFRKNLGNYADGLTYIQYWKASYKYADPFFGSNQKF